MIKIFYLKKEEKRRKKKIIKKKFLERNQYKIKKERKGINKRKKENVTKHN